MKTAEDIESFLIRMGSTYESVGPCLWLVKDAGFDLVVSIAGPVLVFRVKVIELDRIPAERRELFFSKLLQLNASDMLHGAYGLEERTVVATDALQLENLDFNEFQATLEDIAMALSNHYSILKDLSVAA